MPDPIGPPPPPPLGPSTGWVQDADLEACTCGTLQVSSRSREFGSCTCPSVASPGATLLRGSGLVPRPTNPGSVLPEGVTWTTPLISWANIVLVTPSLGDLISDSDTLSGEDDDDNDDGLIALIDHDDKAFLGRAMRLRWPPITEVPPEPP